MEMDKMLNAMIDMLESQLPEDLEIRIGTDNTSVTGQFEVYFSYKGMETSKWLFCSGFHKIDKLHCREAIVDAMIYFAQEIKDRDLEVLWQKDYANANKRY